MNFEVILHEVGDYGPFQKNLINYFLLPSALVFGLAGLSTLFLVTVPDHWCYVPEVVSSNLSADAQRTIVSPPRNQCEMYNISFTDFLENGTYAIPDQTPTKPCDHGWQYDISHYDSTVATKWNLVCADLHYVSLVLTISGAGSITGTTFYGALSDKIGRRTVFFIIILVSSIAGIASILVQNFTIFVTLKVIQGGLIPSVFQQSYIIVLELISQEVRTHVNGITHFAWSSGICILPLVAYLSRSWIIISIVSILAVLALFLYWSFLPESPRWLISRKKYDEATNIMLRIAKKNGKKQDESSLRQKLQTLGEKLQKEKLNGVKNSPCDLIRYPQLRKKFFIITCCWTANQMAYYGLQLNCSNLAGNEFINFFLLALVEIPSYLVFPMMTSKLGRRWCNALGFMLTAIACMFTTINLKHMDVIASMIGKFLAAGTFMTTYQQTSELYPTVVLGLGMGMSCTIAMVINLAVPYLIYLRIYGEEIPLLVIGLVCLFAGILATFLPETLDENLPQSIFEAENFGTSQKYFSWIRKRRLINGGEEPSSSNGDKAFNKSREDGAKDIAIVNTPKVIKSNDVTEKASIVVNQIDVSINSKEKVLENRNFESKNRSSRSDRKSKIIKTYSQEPAEVSKEKPEQRSVSFTSTDKNKPKMNTNENARHVYENVAFESEN